MTLTYEWTVTIDGVDCSDLLPNAGTIDYGRQGDGSGFSAPRAEFDMFTQAGHPHYAGAWPSLDYGQDVTIHVTWDGVTQWRRFTGRIQALDYRAESVHVTCAGNTVDYQDFLAGDRGPFAPRPVESDSDRVEWLALVAPTALTIEGAPARRVRAIERNTPASPLLPQILRVAADADGLFLEDRLGVPRYRTRNFTLPGTYTLPSGAVDWDSLTLSKDRGDRLTTVRVYYGEPDPSTGLQKYRIAVDDDALTEFGFDKQANVVTDLRTPEAADGRAAQFLLEHGDVYTMPDVSIMMSQLTGEEADDILDFQEGWLVTVESLPDGWPIDTYTGRIVGMTDIMDADDYILVLHLEAALDIDAEDDDDPIYPDGIISGYDATGTETIDDKEYRWCRWDTSGVFTVDYDAAVYTRAVAEAGGGGGGSGFGLYGAGGPGGAGGLLNDFLDLNPGTWPITVGTGGAPGEPGTDTVIYGTRLYGGGEGGTGGDGGDGGCGGGAAYNRADYSKSGDPGEGVIGQGYDGNAGGGGTAGPGYANGTGGPGTVIEIGGSSQTFGVGGNGEGSGSSPTTPGSGGPGGWIGHGPAAGSDGVVYLRYRIG